MMDSSVEGVESLRVLRCDGSLTISGTDAPAIAIHSDLAPETRRADGLVELVLTAGGALEVPPGVALEVLDCAGDVVASDLRAPLTMGRLRGNLSVRGIGALAIHGRLSGNLSAEDAGAIEAEDIGGSATVGNARAVRFERLAGNLEMRAIDGDVSLESVGGKVRASRIAGAIKVGRVGGKLEAENVGAVDIAGVGGRAKLVDIARGVRIERVGGRLTLDGVGADVAIESVGGHADVARVAGGLHLSRIGGALDLGGPFPQVGTWRARARGRINIELTPEAAFELEASAGWGRVRVHGIDEENLRWISRGHVTGRIGAGGSLKLDLEASNADIVIAPAGSEAREHDCRRRGRGFRPFEDLAEGLGRDIPEFLSEILDAGGRFASRSGAFSGDYMKGLADDLKRGLGDVMGDFERSLTDLGERVPEEVTDHLKRMGRDLRELVREAVRNRHQRSREARYELREKVRQAARDLSDAIRKAASEARERRSERPGAGDNTTAPPNDAAEDAPTQSARSGREHDRDIMAILKAVHEGKLDPEQADDLIAAWVEVKRAAPHKDA